MVYGQKFFFFLKLFIKLKKKIKIIIHQKQKNKMSSDSLSELPIQPALKITPSAVYVGDPKQLVDLLTSQVAQPVIEIHRTKGGMPLYKCKLRCKALFAGNLDVYFLVDFPNVPLSVEKALDGKNEIILKLHPDRAAPIDSVRAARFYEFLEEAIAFWTVCMEAEVVKVYTDKVPKQASRLASENIINMKINAFQGKEFDPVDFLAGCREKKAFPAFKIGFGWIASKEDPRSEDHLWGFKFEFSTFAQYAVAKRVRAPAASATQIVENSRRKRKAELDADDSSVVATELVAPI